MQENNDGARWEESVQARSESSSEAEGSQNLRGGGNAACAISLSGFGIIAIFLLLSFKDSGSLRFFGPLLFFLVQSFLSDSSWIFGCLQALFPFISWPCPCGTNALELIRLLKAESLAPGHNLRHFLLQESAYPQALVHDFRDCRPPETKERDKATVDSKEKVVVMYVLFLSLLPDISVILYWVFFPFSLPPWFNFFRCFSILFVVRYFVFLCLCFHLCASSGHPLYYVMDACSDQTLSFAQLLQVSSIIPPAYSAASSASASAGLATPSAPSTPPLTPTTPRGHLLQPSLDSPRTSSPSIPSFLASRESISVMAGGLPVPVLSPRTPRDSVTALTMLSPRTPRESVAGSAMLSPHMSRESTVVGASTPAAESPGLGAGVGDSFCLLAGPQPVVADPLFELFGPQMAILLGRMSLDVQKESLSKLGSLCSFCFSLRCFQRFLLRTVCQPSVSPSRRCFECLSSSSAAFFTPP